MQVNAEKFVISLFVVYYFFKSSASFCAEIVRARLSDCSISYQSENSFKISFTKKQLQFAPARCSSLVSLNGERIAACLLPTFD